MADFPTSVTTDASLYVAVNNLSTVLNESLTNSDTTITATATTGFPTVGVITIDQEAIKYTGISGNDFTGCTRGFDGTTAATHANGSVIFHNIVATHHNAPKDEIKAIEQNISDRLGLGSTALTIYGQIAFPAAQVASAGANVLDDYEEGTFTLTLTCGTSGTITLSGSGNTGHYTKIGRQVTVTGYIIVASVSSPVGNLIVNTLPFTALDYAGVGLWCTGLEATAATAMVGFVNRTSTTIIISHFAAGVIGTASADVKAGTEIIFSVTYFV